MCIPQKLPTVSAPKIAAYDNAQSIASGDQQARLRRLRAGPASDILTGSLGIPKGTVTQLGGVAGQ